MDTTVVDNPELSRFEILVDGGLAGFAAYRLRPGQTTFTHTQIEPAYEGHGLGSRLAAAVLDEARGRGLTVEPRCPFIAAYLRRHPDRYADLVQV